MTRTLRRSSFSEVGRQVDLVAPGGSGAFDSPRGIFSTYAGSGYVRMPGTSMAAPYVSGTMALTIERQRALGLQVNPVDVVLGSATDLGAQGRDDQFGFGLVSPNRALSTLNTLQATGGAAGDRTNRSDHPGGQAGEITVRKGYLKYRIPAKGRFIVGWQSYSQRKWSELNRFNGKRDGQTWYGPLLGGMQVRIVAMRAGQKKKTDPIWVSRTFRTRAASLPDSLASWEPSTGVVWPSASRAEWGRLGRGWLTGSSLWIGILAAIGAVIGMNTGWGKTDG